uniref:Uncharacterized protein n=1 Tax=Arundo donax TaxID=35708 RepID=A0A0A9AAZ6_ARUDO
MQIIPRICGSSEPRHQTSGPRSKSCPSPLN